MVDHGKTATSTTSRPEGDPALVAAFEQLGREDRSVLTPEFRALVQLSLAAACTQLDLPAIEQAIDRARAHGSTFERVRSVSRITSTVGIHSATTGLPILSDVLRERGDTLPGTAAERAAVRRRFIELRGGWHPIWDTVADADPALLDDYCQVSEVVWGDPALEPWEQELICVAFDVATSHLYEPGVRLHIAGALGKGASIAMVQEVIAMACAVGRCTTEYVMPYAERAWASEL